MEKTQMLKNVLTAFGDEDVSLSVLEQLAENSFDSVLITDASRSSKIIYANQAFRNLTGFEPSEVVGKTPRILQGPATDKKVLERLGEALEQGIQFEGTAINYRKDGTPFIMEWRVVPAKMDGKIKAWLAIQRQGTEVK